MTLIPERCTVGYLVSESFCPSQPSQTSEVSDFVVYRHGWREEPQPRDQTEREPSGGADVELQRAYAAFADEDRELANAGIGEYRALLDLEDHDI